MCKTYMHSLTLTQLNICYKAQNTSDELLMIQLARKVTRKLPYHHKLLLDRFSLLNGHKEQLVQT